MINLMRGKRGEFPDYVTGFILAILILGVLIFFFYNLLSTNYDPVNEATKSFYDNIEDQINLANSGGVGEFVVWDYDSDDGVNYYIVYFGESFTYLDFQTKLDGENKLCVCSAQEGIRMCKSNSCSKLAHSVELQGNTGENFVIESNKFVSVRKEGGNYKFVLE